MSNDIDLFAGGGALPDSNDMHIKALFSVLSADQKEQFISLAAYSLKEQSTLSFALELRDVINL